MLGRPWIHMVETIPSTLHQQLKYIMNRNLVTISPEHDHPREAKGSILIIGVDESIEPSSFQAFEVSFMNYHPFRTLTFKPRVSPKVMSVAQEMIAKKFQPVQGLGKNGQGIRYLIQLPTHKGKDGPGYTGKTKRGNPLQRDSI